MRDTAGSPERARWLPLARSGSQSQRAIWFILPARGASHIIIIITATYCSIYINNYCKLCIVDIHQFSAVNSELTSYHQFYPMFKGPDEARRFVEDFVITQLQGEELHKILFFENPDKVLDNIFTTQGKEKPVAR